jgi:hypothetical protein
MQPVKTVDWSNVSIVEFANAVVALLPGKVFCGVANVPGLFGVNGHCVMTR